MQARSKWQEVLTKITHEQNKAILPKRPFKRTCPSKNGQLRHTGVAEQLFGQQGQEGSNAGCQYALPKNHESLWQET